MEKKKSGHQQDPCTQNAGDSTDTNDENKTIVPSRSGCQHVHSAVDLPKVRKAVKSGGLALECFECSKKKSSVGDEDLEKSTSSNLWLCLQCGNQGCSRDKGMHALKHYEVPRSDCHALAVDTQHWNVWCYKCNMEMDPRFTKKLDECVKFLKQREGTKRLNKPMANTGGFNSMGRKAADLAKPLADVTNLKQQPLSSSVFSKNISNSVVEGLPRVRGLVNLGNTCFFNAVLQCLARTPFLLSVLEEMKEPGAKFCLPGGTNPYNKDGPKLPPLEGELGKRKALTEIFAETLTKLQSSDIDTLNPRPLLDKLAMRCPQFSDGDQHDSHELLRHLLDAVRAEDVKRYQKTILTALDMSVKQDPNTVEEEKRLMIKAYGQQVQELVLHSEQIFNGHLVSTLECQDCKHSSQRVENFLDLSLPITVDKPQPPMLRKKNSTEAQDFYGSQDEPSKHQLKKKAQKMRKVRKMNNQRGAAHKNDIGESAIAEESGAGEKKNLEQNDADVEDNLDQDAAINCHTNGESGYSSEKAGHEDSAVGSPVPPTNGDSALASPSIPHADYFSSETFSLTLAVAPLHSASASPMVSPLSSGVNPPGSPASPSPVSSELNVHVDGTSETFDEQERPCSRFDFCASADNFLGPTVPQGAEGFIKDVCAGIERDNPPSEGEGQLLKDTFGGSADEDIDLPDLGQPWEINGPHRDLVPSPETADDTEEKKKDEDDLEMIVTEDTKNRTLAPRYQCEEGECSVQSCLNQFTALELMTGNNKVGCSNCTQKYDKGKDGKKVCTNSTKQFLICSPPAVLILHLKRFQVHTGTFKKISRHVGFPLLLDLAPICSTKCKDNATMRPDQTQILYSLYGVVEHSGTIHGGHYVAFVKVRPQLKECDPRWRFVPPTQGSLRKIQELPEDAEPGSIATGGVSEPPPGKWYCVSDSRVKEVDENMVLKSQAYLLFYERIW